MNRRHFLTFSVPALVTGIAGCSSRREESPGLLIDTLELENLTSRDAVFDVAIVDGSETTVFETEQPVAGKSAAALDQPINEPNQYTISLEADGQALTQEISLFAEEGDSCVIAVGRLDQAGRLRIEGNGYSDCTAQIIGTIPKIQ